MRLVLLGAPGSGKGTQGVVLAEHFGVPHVSSGALLRREVAAVTTLGRRVERYVASGELVPDDLVLAIVVGALGAGARAEGYILDGFPRTLTQARSACAVAPSDGIAVDVVVYLAMPDDVARRRVADRAAQGRVDDTDAAVIERRLLVFHRETRPLLDFYRERRLLRSVDADRPVDDVTDAIFVALADAVAPISLYVPHRAGRATEER
jgi:adenylate kinase